MVTPLALIEASFRQYISAAVDCYRKYRFPEIDRKFESAFLDCLISPSPLRVPSGKKKNASAVDNFCLGGIDGFNGAFRIGSVDKNMSEDFAGQTKHWNVSQFLLHNPLEIHTSQP